MENSKSSSKSHNKGKSNIINKGSSIDMSNNKSMNNTIRQNAGSMETRPVMIMHLVLVVLEVIAVAYLLMAEGLPVFRYYTVDSNVLQLAVSAGYLVCFVKKRKIPAALTVLHLVTAVCLTITFLIAAFVLMPQSTFAYYFLINVAPIVHFFAPMLAVITFLLSGNAAPRGALFAPMGATVLYGIAALILNFARLLKGPYFFLEVYSTPVGTIVMWFAIIIILCLALSAVFIFLHGRIVRRRMKYGI